jgi:hypothetical protein
MAGCGARRRSQTFANYKLGTYTTLVNKELTRKKPPGLSRSLRA